MEDNENPQIRHVEGIVVDGEGRPVQSRPSHHETKFNPRFSIRWGGVNTLGLVPKLIFGALAIGVLFAGLTISGIAIGIFILQWLVRAILRTMRG